MSALDEIKEQVEKALGALEENPNVTSNEDGTKTVKLEYPVEHKDKLIETLTFRRPKGKDWLRTDEEKGDLAKTFRLAASTAGVTIDVIKNMDGEDAMLCAQVAGSFGKKSQKIGGTF